MAERDTPAVLAYRVGELETAFKEGMKELGGKLDDLAGKFTPKEDHVELAARVTKLENKDNLKNTLLWVGLCASALINIGGAMKLFGAL